jgi:hypothetical protein
MRKNSAIATAILGVVIAIVSLSKLAKAAPPAPKMPEMAMEFDGLEDEEYGRIVDALDKRGEVITWGLGIGLHVSWIPDSPESLEWARKNWGKALIKIYKK